MSARPSTGAEEPVTKRPAFESGLELLQPDGETPARRPAQITVGSVLVVLRALAGIGWLTALAFEWPGVLREIEVGAGAVPDDVAGGALAVILAVGASVALLQIVFAWLVYRGVNGARIVVMVLSAATITAAAVDYFAGDQEITLRTTLITLALDILVLLALSSRAARSWSRRPRP